MSLTKLKKTYSEEGLVLALGAGVSTGAGLPGWRELLKSVGTVCLGKDGYNLVRALIKEGFSLPSIAGMLKASCRGGKNFPNIVRAELYRGFTYNPSATNAVNSKLMIDCIQKNKNQTLNAVASFCAVRDERYVKHDFYVRNPKVHAIINCNLDAVLREYAEVRYPQINGHPILRTVERASKLQDPQKISVYHVHGYLRFDRKANRRDKEASDKLVFGEQEYFDFFNNPTSLFNYTFLYMLREYSCLFIGLSMQDDNIRRLLHYSRQERVQAFKDEKKKNRVPIESKVLRHFVILEEPKLETKRKLIEKALNYLGTIALWVDKYRRIPELLGEVYGKDVWPTVYRKQPASVKR